MTHVFSGLKRTLRGSRTDRVSTLDLMICGTRRSGTSSLLHYLGEHPEIEFLDSRELEPIGGALRGFPFNNPFTAVSCRPDAADMYDAATARRRDKARCLAWRAVYAVYFPHITYNLAEHLPDLRILFSLRDPAETTYSVYCRKWESGNTTETFEEAMRLDPSAPPLDPDDGRPGWARFYRKPSDIPAAMARGFCYPGVKRFFDLFPRDQIHVISFTDLVAAPQETLRGILRFLDLDDDFDFTRTRAVRSASKKPGPLRPETRTALDEIFADNNRRLFDLLGWPHDVWSSRD